MSKIPPPKTNEERLDAILLHLQRLDKRDQLRTWSSFARSLIALIPLVLFLVSAWYFYNHADEIIQKMASEAAKQAAAYSQQETKGLLEKMGIK